MSVPLDRLYNYLDSICNHDILIYRFYPHGSKKLTDLHALLPYRDWTVRMTKPMMICHDQEPLCYDLYTLEDFEQATANFTWWPINRELLQPLHFRSITGLQHNTFDKTLLLHSELNSDQVTRFEQNNFIGVYWWSHAAIARDWYRYAEHDPDLDIKASEFDCDFLIYNRAWSGSREYRLKFTELLINAGLDKSCLTKFNPVDGIDYREHVWANNQLKISRTDLEQYFDINNTGPNASADYTASDYNSAGIEIVLETLFDDTRHHLTEKTLRPIACGKPFMLTGTPGSLQYLKRYGFMTFGDFIDESYDQILDPAQRLLAIVKEMQRIANLTASEKTQLWDNLHRVAKYNRDLFFSDSWHDSVVKEFVDNLNSALVKIWPHRRGNIWKYLRTKVPTDVHDPTRVHPAEPGAAESMLQWLDTDIPVLKINP